MGNSKSGTAVSKPSALDPQEQKCLDDVARFGCHILKVFDDKGEAESFAYSVGFPVSVEQPEVLVYGLPPELMASMIRQVRQQCSEGLVLADGARIGNLLEGHDCIARSCRSRKAIEEHLGWAIWYHRTQRSEEVNEFYQIVWPGAVNGLFPWGPGASPDVIDAQPALYESVE